jgi:hypothetical protein
MAVPVYCTREQVMAAVDIAATTRSALQIDRVIRTASRGVDALCHRRFYPEVRTLTLDWPGPASGYPWELWLDANELVSVTAVTSAGSDITASVFLRPDDGPPYTRLEIDRASSATWSSGSTAQRSISITGVFAGAPVEETSVGELAEAVDTSETLLDVDDSSGIGVGSLLRFGNERVIVERMALLATGQVLGGDLAASKAAASFTVADGTQLHPDETITVGGERMVVRDIAGNTVLVDRATDALGALMTHTTGAAVYAPRQLVVERGAVGTTAAAHDSGAVVWRWDPPALVATCALQSAVFQLQQEQAGMARTAGSGENVRQVTASGLGLVRDECRRAHGRMARTRAV